MTRGITGGIVSAITAAIVGLGGGGGAEPIDGFNFAYAPSQAASGVGPGLTSGFTYTRTNLGALVPDYLGILHEPKTNEIPLWGGRRIDHANSTNYGWGANGIEWLSTGPSGEDLTDPAEGFPVLCGGFTRRPQIVNTLARSNMATGWAAVGSATVTGGHTAGPRGASTATRIQTSTTANGLQQQIAASPSGAGSKYTFSVMFDDLASSANIQLVATGTSMTGANASMIVTPADGTIGTTANTTAATVAAVPGHAGWYRARISFVTTGGGTLILQVLQSGAGAVDIVADNANCDTRETLSDPVISLAAAYTAPVEVAKWSAAALGYLTAGGVFAVEFTPHYPASYNSNGQVIWQNSSGTADIFQLFNKNGTGVGTYMPKSFVDQAGLGPTIWTEGVKMIAVFRVEANDVRLVVNEETPVADATATMTTFTEFLVGSGNFSGTFGRHVYYPPDTVDNALMESIAAGTFPVIA